MTQEYVWFITGANRGIGLEMVKQLLQSPANIIVAAARDPAKATELQGLAENAGGKLRLLGIDYLINNAGVMLGGEDTAFSMYVDVLTKTFATNVGGPALVTQAFIGLVEKSEKKTVVNISSTVGSIASDFGAKAASYAISKAALNMLTYKEAKEKPDLTVILMCPGWLQTDLGGPDAILPVSVGVGGVLKTILALKPEDSGTFFNFQGQGVPW
ncbi:NAD-P-binding protein [Polyporus arcularius HHB13444]|uniref:NAD-P-binding protein n=1 Tax=Polyporus arcularius HHB13444 TaxID=1314778 RepID=A0A5C3PDJ6_9APHY|nr:NAD-P-binding protein [Polyporus arcularius HHB13444]